MICTVLLRRRICAAREPGSPLTSDLFDVRLGAGGLESGSVPCHFL